jgi:DNA-binding IscR family transcriptional regulator
MKTKKEVRRELCLWPRQSSQLMLIACKLAEAETVWVPVSVLQRLPVPEATLPRLLRKLTDAEIVERKQEGVSPLYRLAKPPADIPVWDVVILGRGRQADWIEPDSVCATLHAWTEQTLQRRFERLTLKNLIDRIDKEGYVT